MSRRKVGGFARKVGQTVSVVREIYTEPARNPDQGHPEVGFIHRKKNGVHYFTSQIAHMVSGRRGQVVFLPAGVQQGDTLVITWADRTCTKMDLLPKK